MTIRKVNTLTSHERELILKAFGENADIEKVITDFNTFIEFDRMSFEDYMNRMAETRAKIESDKEESKKYEYEAKAIMTKLLEKYDVNALKIKSEAKKIAKSTQNRHLQMAILNELKGLNQKIKNQREHVEKSITGPIYYDDVDPTFYDENMKEI